MTTYACTEPDYILVAIADLQPDPLHPLDPQRLNSVRTAMRNGEPLPQVLVYRGREKGIFLGACTHKIANGHSDLI